MGKKKAPAPKAESSTSGAKASESSEPSRQQRPATRRPAKKSCDWLCWAVTPIILVGILPLIVLHLPFIVPPTDDINGQWTMVGGPTFQGIHGLWSTVNKFGTKFCGEHGQKDTIKCYWSVLEMTFHILRSPGMVDFYTTIPQYALREETVEQYEGAVSPLFTDKQWIEGAVDYNGVGSSQVATALLNLVDVSESRLAPMSTSHGTFGLEFHCMDEEINYIPCQNEFEKVIGAKRVPIMGSDLVKKCGTRRLGSDDIAKVRDHVDSEVWNGKRKVLYAFGIESAIALAKSIPPDMSPNMAVTIVILPIVDQGFQWNVASRGRAKCDGELFRKGYDNTFRYFAWVLRTSRHQKMPAYPGLKN
eukprot:TRINITY_DN4530_c1_g2_i1.p1 TRINITY_DN4530_c1_g2~~TRINITY_DN4530_c1_g2_i1.p1  ORF type:complete len:382 (+),score=52.51 TRINITY_DN4530_c1_g2_i1:66-1148(+)